MAWCFFVSRTKKTELNAGSNSEFVLIRNANGVFSENSPLHSFSKN